MTYMPETAIAALIPSPANTTPSAVADTGTAGAAATFARGDHTHAAKARKAKAQGITAGTYTWTYPTAFGAGIVPVIGAIAQVATGNTDLYNVQVMGVPTNTQCVLQINRVSAGLLNLLLGALSINPTPGSITLHLLAFEP